MRLTLQEIEELPSGSQPNVSSPWIPSLVSIRSIRAMCLLFSCFVGTGLGATSGLRADTNEEDVVLRFGFDGSSESEVEPHRVRVHDELVEGPRPPLFPNFDASNTAIRFPERGSRLEIDDLKGVHSPLDFTNGDSISFSVWVQPEPLSRNGNVYIVGKGRTHREGFPKDNQNWALRLTDVDGFAHISFLFADERVGKGGGQHWHRWTSALGFEAKGQWHHLALSYTFGKPDSISCWVDGVPSNGNWDMGGATKLAPHVDDDQVWVGSSMGGNLGNSFVGQMDELTVYRRRLGSAEVNQLARRQGDPREYLVGIERMPDVPFLEGEVLFEAFEAVSDSHARWYRSHQPPKQAIARWTAPHFFMHRMPYRYDSWGVRESWKPPAMVRASARVQLPAGRHTLLVRARGLSRVWVNGQVVVRTGPHAGSTDGHNPVDPLPEPPKPELRRVGFGDHEAIGEFNSPAGQSVEVVLEMIVGGSSFRVEPGESLLAIESPDGKSFYLLGSEVLRSSEIELTNVAIDRYRRSMEHHLDQVDDEQRRFLASSNDDFWLARHRYARQVVRSRQDEANASFDAEAADSVIDRMIMEKLEEARAMAEPATSAEVTVFEQQIQPLLQARCFRCHDEKAKGGLRLSTLALAKAGGDSGDPAIVEGDAESSQLFLRVLADGDEQMPPGEPLSDHDQALLRQWIDGGATWPKSGGQRELPSAAAVVDDASFMRRAHLDTVGTLPSASEVKAFLDDPHEQKRELLVDRLLEDHRVADNWVSYWQDVLAENPNPLKPSLNNTGPFRWFLYERLRDNTPVDRLVTELVMLRGSEREGGSAGFGFAADNDAPMAARSMVLASAFTGVDLQCARCHDSPYSSPKQEDLFALAAMLARKPLAAPKTSSVSPGFFDATKGRRALIEVTLQPGKPVKPVWPFTHITGALTSADLEQLTDDPTDSRQQLAAYLTAPQNRRFAQVIVNRVWKRLIGVGFVEPVHDWEGQEPSHPELLAWLADDFAIHGYDFKHLMRRIMRSDVYQRAAVGINDPQSAKNRYFVNPSRRRMTAEQIVDSLFAATSTPLHTEEITFDPEARRPPKTMISLGAPERAWQFATLANERDRPSLNLPRAQAVVDILTAFGWTGSRQNPVHERDSESNVLQPGILSNGTVTTWITRASTENGLTDWAESTASPADLSEFLYLQFLGRYPSVSEQRLVTELLQNGFEDRIVPVGDREPMQRLKPLGRVSWSNHLAAEANSIKIELGRRAEQGPAPDPRLTPAWREAYEDVVWALINSPEFIWIP